MIKAVPSRSDSCQRVPSRNHAPNIIADENTRSDDPERPRHPHRQKTAKHGGIRKGHEKFLGLHLITGARAYLILIIVSGQITV